MEELPRKTKWEQKKRREVDTLKPVRQTMISLGRSERHPKIVVIMTHLKPAHVMESIHLSISPDPWP